MISHRELHPNVILSWDSQIGIFDLSFGHNLCFKYSNASCKPILEIYISRVFQWYKKFFNPMKFDSWNTSLKIQKSIRTPIRKVGAHLGVCGFIPSHSHTFPGMWNVTPKLPSWPAPLQALALVVSSKLGSQQRCSHFVDYGKFIILCFD